VADHNFKQHATSPPRLLTVGRSGALESPPPLDQVLVVLGTRLTPLVGTEGYRRLLERALDQASSDYPQLVSVRPGLAPAGRLVGLRQRGRRLAADTTEALVRVLAELLSLLDEFIGRELTDSIVGDAAQTRRLASRPSASQATPRGLTRTG
jgi:hypothetical protein